MKSRIALITLALAGAAYAAWTPKDSAVDYPTMSVPAAGDAIPIWDAGTDATQQIFWSTFVSSFQGLDADLTSWAAITPGTGVGTFLATPSSANFAGALTDESGTGAFLTTNGVGAALTVTASGFNGNLATTDDTVQEIAQKVDDLVASSGSVATDTIFDAAGDIVQGTGANTATRLPIGTAGQLLKVNAGATALEYTSSPSVASLTVSGAVTAGSIAYNGALAADDTAGAITLTGLTAGAIIAQWEAVYIGGSSTYLLADANGSGTYPARGLAAAAYSSTNAAVIVTSGTVRNDAWAWTPGGTIYLSATAGGLTQTIPATTGDKIQVIGYALTADIMMVAISPDFGTSP